MAKPVHVLIVGAGPVGAVTALAFARKGLEVTVLEADEAYDERPRAATTHASTLDMLGELGIVDQVIAQGLISRRFQHWDRVTGALVAEFDFDRIAGETAHPYAVQCESHKLVNIALAALNAYPNARVLRRYSATGVLSGDREVRVLCDTPGGPVEISGDYLVGTDGARSVVRKSMGVAFDGYTFPERFVGLTTPYDFEVRYGYSNRNYFADPERWVMLFKVAGNDLRGLWRVISPAAGEESDEAVLAEEALQARLQHFFPKDTSYDIHYRGLYKFHQRVASRFSVGRVFLAGDAAHVNNPAGGLGMNSGIHDGMELAELFDLLSRGAKDASVLDRYDRRRRPLNVEFIQQQTVANKRRLEERDPATRQARLDELRAICADPVRHKAFLMRSSLVESVRRAAEIE